MNILEKIVEEANSGELARIDKAVQCAKNTNVITDHYTSTGPEKEEGTIVPPHVNAGDIIAEMARDNREHVVEPLVQEDMPYFIQENEPVNNSITKEDDELER